MRRREFIGAAALAAVALRPASALAASDEGGLLLGLWRREVAAEFAYAKVLPTDPVFAVLRSHENEHYRALATELAAVGLGTPKPPENDDDLDSASQRLATAKGEAVLPAAVALEEDLVAMYRQAVPALPDAKIAMTAATILASHAQHLLIVRRVAGVT
jgi:hypothetical protein